jgi:hypothetical protein
LVDDADEEPFEAADGFASAFSFGSFSFEVGARAWLVAGLGDRDAVEGGVELAVAAAVESVALDLPPSSPEVVRRRRGGRVGRRS